MNSKKDKISDIKDDNNINKIDKENNNLYLKVQNIIKNAKMEKYISDREKISVEGISFWGGITGKNNLQIERLKNVKLKIELLQSQKIEQQKECNSKDLMAELYACAISELGGKFNTEMAEIYKKIKKEYLEEEISEEYIYELACKKISDGQSYLPIIHQERTKGIFGDIKVQTEFLKLENMKLQNQIIKSRGKSQFQTFSEQEDKKHQVIIPVAWENRKKA